jgi:hypothetical protein
MRKKDKKWVEEQINGTVSALEKRNDELADQIKILNWKREGKVWSESSCGTHLELLIDNHIVSYCFPLMCTVPGYSYRTDAGRIVGIDLKESCLVEVSFEEYDKDKKRIKRKLFFMDKDSYNLKPVN